MTKKIPRALREVLSQRTIDDLAIKMKIANETPQEVLNQLFFEMCELGFSQYISTEQKRFPNKTPSEIMRNYYKNRQPKHHILQ